jgi:CRISPR/Cas system CSM-associated protein Csm3 (group 7 of RAMP superfamily)
MPEKWQRSPWNFQRRVRFLLRGRTESPMHVGDGEDASLQLRCQALGMGDPESDPQYATVCMAAPAGDPAVARPCIPGSAVKGVLRSWCKQNGRDPAMLETLFGPERIVAVTDAQAPPVKNGKLRFYAARFISGPALGGTERWWDSNRRTCVQPGVSIDPHTRTASEHLLFYAEFVPAGSSFEFSFEGDGLTDQEIAFFHGLLNTAFGGGGMQFGAHTNNGWGRIKLDGNGISVSACGAQQIRKWWSDTADCPEFVPFTPAVQAFAPSADALEFKVKLMFTGGFLISDPSRKKRRTNDEPGLGHGTLRGPDRETPEFPAASFRGPLRAQARRIWRTLGGTVPHPPPQVHSMEDVRNLCGFLKLFGAPGWKAPVQVSAFTLLDSPETCALDQEFVAIDRFTGGAADQKKYNVAGLWRPVFEGSIRVDRGALKSCGVGNWYQLFLRFLLRDLAEGDISFGWGAARGYGHCVAEVPQLGQFTQEHEKSLQAEIQRGGING